MSLKAAEVFNEETFSTNTPSDVKPSSDRQDSAEKVFLPAKDVFFKGTVVHRPSPDYQVHVSAGCNVRTKGPKATEESRYNAAAYCYALSSYPERARPKAIFFADDLSDVKRLGRAHQ